MIDGKRVLAIVPARGGSKGIPLKNLRPVLGVPLIVRAGNIAAQVPEIDRSVTSTDHDEIAQAGEASGLAAPFRRPPELSGDRISDWDVLNHALIEMERLDGVRYDIVVMLQPTSPMRQPEDVSKTISMLSSGDWDAVWTVSETDSKSHPLKQLQVSQRGDLHYYDPDGANIIARQQLTPVYHRNGVAYAITRDCLLSQTNIKGKRTGALIIKTPQVSIDTEWDIALVDFVMKKNGLT